jgi:hypothetical protein
MDFGLGRIPNIIQLIAKGSQPTLTSSGKSNYCLESDEKVTVILYR